MKRPFLPPPTPEPAGMRAAAAGQFPPFLAAIALVLIGCVQPGAAELPPRVVLADGGTAPAGLQVTVTPERDLFRATLKNTTPQPWQIREVVLLD
ncbi:hypothetical protein EG829_31865, partial [bacterium]|nr:hypothetical protein [bacterium]